MVKPLYIDWDGKSGKEYRYWIYEMDTTLAKGPGNYIFAKEIKTDEWSPVYIGQTADLSQRFEDHPKMACIKQRGATHIHTHEGGPDEDIRLAEERDLAARWYPACND